MHSAKSEGFVGLVSKNPELYLKLHCPADIPLMKIRKLSQKQNYKMMTFCSTSSKAMECRSQSDF